MNENDSKESPASQPSPSLREALDKIRNLPRYNESDVQRRPSVNEYVDAESLDEILAAQEPSPSERGAK